MTVDDVLARIRAHLDLEAETEYDLLQEIRAHLEEAVEAAAQLARPGEVVLLSPGGTSFDAFRDFAERGDRFKELVQQLG